MRPPKRVHLPSGRVFVVKARDTLASRARARSSPLFAEAVDLVASGDVVLLEDGAPVDVRALDLRDFHTFRAIATRLGWLEEDPVDLACRNCEEKVRHLPCGSLALGPFVDGELDDPELDRTLDLRLAHAVPQILLAGGRVAREAKLGPISVAAAEPLHRALRRRRLVISGRIVRAMGLESLGDERDPRRIAEALSRCADEAWEAIGDLYLEAHYPPRLCSIAICPKCGARNDVDAPYEREFEPSGSRRQSNAQVFPDFDQFDAQARAALDRCAVAGGPEVRLVVDEGIPACDDGGEPLLGSYVPPAGDPTAPVGVGEVTVYYRTFRAMWNEEGPFDWEAELDETIEHELEHHAGWQVGHDPMDDEERAEIALERMALLGRKEAVRQTASTFAADVREFLARTWPLWLIVAAATIAITVCGR